MKIPKYINKIGILIYNFDKIKNIKIKNQKVLITRKRKLFMLILFFIYVLSLNYKKTKYKQDKKLKIGVVGVTHEINVGNNLLKYALSIILKDLGFIPFIIGTRCTFCNISFLNKTTNLVIIKNSYNEIKKDDYDILMVNSDQTWRKFDKHFLDYGFLKFAKNWNITKFIYGASFRFIYKIIVVIY